MMNTPTDSFSTTRPSDHPTIRLFWLLLLSLFALPALMPLLTATPTRSADGLLHLYRLVQLNELWRQGIFFSRWLPDVAYSYGLPLFNYYASLVYYVTTPLHVFGISFPLALNLSLAAALLFGAVGMFFFAHALLSSFVTDVKSFTSPDRREVRGEMLSALIAALAFLYAPYVLFNALYRANLAEQWALAFAPFALWRFLELTRKPNVWNWAFAVVMFAAVMLSHNVTGFLFAPLLFGFILACIPSTRTRRDSTISLGAFFLALALSAFFWLPALVERDYVQIARVIVTPDFDYRFNFVAPQELFALLPRADTGRMNPTFPNTPGLAQIILGVSGIVTAAIFFRTRRALPLFFLAAAALMLTLVMLSLSQPLWDNVTLLSFVQLPMRLRGLVALCLAPFTGIFLFLVASRWRVVATALITVLIVLSAMPMLYPRYARDVPTNPTLTDMFSYEKKAGAFGTTSFAEYLPLWVQELPDKSPFEEAYVRGIIPDRFVIPEGVRVCGSEVHPTVQSVCVSAATPWQVVYRAFYFPGWRAYVNGKQTEITPTPRTGLISFRVAQGESVSVKYEGTLLEHVAEWISIASIILLVCIVVFSFINTRRRAKQNISSTEHRRHFTKTSVQFPCTLHPSSFILLLTALALVGFKIFYVDRTSNPFVAHFDGAQLQGLEPRNINFENAMQLLGAEIDSHSARRGQTVRVTLYWRALPDLKKNLSAFAHLTALDGFVLAQKDSLHPANVPTTQWEIDAYAADEHAFEIPASLAPGEYQVRAGVYDPATNTRVKTTDGADYVLVGKIIVQE